MTKKLFIFTLMGIYLLLASSCRHGDSIVMEKLDRVDSLMKVHPDSAYTLLEAMREEAEQAGEAARMRHLLFTADACNKLYRQMPSQEAFQPVVDYYDENGSPNERMKALYLMGCIYRDGKEAPMALKHFQEAAECADTLDSDCDFKTLYPIYGQIAKTYYHQYMLKQSIDAYQKYSHFALLAGDTCSSIQGIELMVEPYSLMKDTLKVLEITREVHDQYLNHGRKDLAARVYPTSMYIYLSQHNYFKVKTMMEEFEGRSGLFDESGEIVNRMYRYHYAKGLYYLGLEKLDSAEQSFRKLLSHGYIYEGADGLMRCYRSTGEMDSIFKYQELKDKASEDVLSGIQADAMYQTAAMYDFSRLQHQNDMLLVQKEREKYKFWAIITIASIIIIITARKYYCYRLKKRKELDRLRYKNDTLNRKMKDIERSSNLNKLAGSDITKRLREYVMPHSSLPSSQTIIDELIDEANRTVPLFMNEISKKNALNKHEVEVCLLSLLDFSTKEIAILLNMTNANVSNMRLKANKSIFGEATATTLTKNLKNMKGLKVSRR